MMMMMMMKLYLLVLVALCCQQAAAHPTFIYESCTRTIAVGATIMGNSAVGSTSSDRSVVIRRNGAILSSGDDYIPNETLTVTLSDTSGEYIFVTAGATFPVGASSGACSGTRSLLTTSTLQMPDAGEGPVTVKAAWAVVALGTVTITDDFTLTEGTAPTPNTNPTAAPTGPTTAPTRRPKVTPTPTTAGPTPTPTRRPRQPTSLRA
jgi:photosystem II stability/assembly factor-like uncharacterized protein